MGSSDRATVFHALNDAIGWQSTLADAYRHIPDSPEREDALKQVREYRALIKKRYGARPTDTTEIAENTLDELRRRNLNVGSADRDGGADD